MTHPVFHAATSAKRWGGKPGDYQAIHDWLVFIWTVRQLPMVAMLKEAP